TRRVKRAGFEVLESCVELGGSLSGEHGIGADKRAAMAWLFTPETLALFRRVKEAFDPGRLSNPDKLIPTAEESARPSRVRFPRRELSEPAARLVETVREAAARGAPLALTGAATRLPRRENGCLWLELLPLSSIRELDRGNYTATVEAGARVPELRAALAAEGFHLPFGPAAGTLGGAIACRSAWGLRDNLLGARALLASGEVVELGGKVVKNVAGYDLLKVLLGSQGGYAALLEVTFRVLARPPVPGSDPLPAPFAPNRWHRALKKAFDPGNRLNPWVFGA
ncbi:MAG: FAD-binding protein, partial [Elusimicrobia bacterium]|nr:FAD-binding protein [Elusimicrobiota bacterium]